MDSLRPRASNLRLEWRFKAEKEGVVTQILIGPLWM